MARLVMPENALNGGFPEPPASAPVRVVAAHHDACGADTRVRLPGTVPARAVRRFHCAGCAAAFTTRHVEEIELRLTGDPVAEPEPPRPAVSVPRLAVTRPAPARKRDATKPKPVRKATKAPRAKQVKQPQAARSKARGPKLPAFASREISMPKLSLPAFATRDLSLPKLSGRKGAEPKAPTLSDQKPKGARSFDPNSRTWRLLSIGVAGLAVIAILFAVRGGGDEPTPSAVPAAATAAPVVKVGDGKGADKASKPAKNTKFVSESSFSLALPAGWERVDPPAGATFAAVAADGGADATLWIKEDPKLDFPTFISQSLAQLRTLAGSAEVSERIPGPTAEGTVVRLSANAPVGQPTYDVTLRVAGPYRYYLATTVQPDASTDVVDGIDLITGSFTPELGG